MSEMRRLMILLVPVLLVAGLCGCAKVNVVDPDRLTGTWCKVYPEGVAKTTSWRSGYMMYLPGISGRNICIGSNRTVGR